MQIIKKINNNVAIALDDSNQECVVFGKGVGFPATPYELHDTSVIQRIFKNVDPKLSSIVSQVSDTALLAASDIVDLAKMELDHPNLNPGLVFTLADHIDFAIKRFSEGLTFQPAYTSDLAYVYPKEAELGKMGLGIVSQRCHVTLPDEEAAAISMHIIAASGVDASDSTDHIKLVKKTTKIIEKAAQIIEIEFNTRLDKSSYAFVRFAAHFRFLVSRLEEKDTIQTDNDRLFAQAATDFPEIYTCAERISRLLLDEEGWSLTNEELLYLMMHINRLISK